MASRGRPRKKHKRGKLTASEQANLVILKETKPNGEKNSDIAEKFGISVSSVAHMSAESLTHQAKQLYKQKKQRLAELSIDVVESALVKGKELIDGATDTKALSGIAAVGSFADKVHRLETNQPTEIRHTLEIEEHALEFIKLVMRNSNLEKALEYFMQASLEPVIPDHAKAEIVKKIERGDLKLLTA